MAGPKRFNDAYTENLTALQERGIDPYSDDDTAFGVEYVYCGGHLRAHLTGWCTVHNVMKVPLEAKDQASADNECRYREFTLYIDLER